MRCLERKRPLETNKALTVAASRRVAVLPDHIANKIAAGEVIQRPESVVKELLENSLDAGARAITVIIRAGGSELIEVGDDGAGMDEVDAKTAFLRHATSKISTVADLEAIATYGFRGEALASIAAVAQVTMTTRRKEDDLATVVQIGGSGRPDISKEARQPGTTISVRNLFYNVPARKKFLKSQRTEYRHLYDAVQRIALSHPEVAIEFVSDGETILDLRPGTLHQRLVDIFGERLVEAMVPMEEQSEPLSVSGYIGKPVFGQKTRLNQFLFLNGRYIVNRSINHAVISSYENLLTKGLFPFFLIFLEIDPARVDVNVHPSKLEAKFEDEQSIYRFVTTLIRRTLATNDLIPSLSVSHPVSASDEIGLHFTNRQHQPFPSTGTGSQPPASIGGSTTGFPQVDGEEFASRLLGGTREGGIRIPAADSAESEGKIFDGSLWQVHYKYIVLQIDGGVMIVDQHVAHERVLYEQALRRFSNKLSTSQQLLFPRTVPLSTQEYALIEELHEYLGTLGFGIKLFGKQTIVIEGVPPDLRQGDEIRVLQDLLATYRENLQHGIIDTRDNIAKSYSCKAAIKAGDRLNDLEMRELIGQLFTTENPYVCPHGRPVVLKISTEELDRRFGRA